MVLSDVLSKEEYEQERIASKLGNAARLVSIKGKEHTYSAIIANGVPIEYRLFTIMMIRFMGGYTEIAGAAINEDLANFWKDIDYKLPQAELDAAKAHSWWNDGEYAVVLDNIMTCVTGEKNNTPYNIDMMPVMKYLAEQIPDTK